MWTDRWPKSKIRIVRKKKLKPGQKVIYRDKEYIFVEYTKTSPGDDAQRIDLKIEGKDYIIEMHERDLYENWNRNKARLQGCTFKT